MFQTWQQSRREGSDTSVLLPLSVIGNVRRTFHVLHDGKMLGGRTARISILHHPQHLSWQITDALWFDPKTNRVPPQKKKSRPLLVTVKQKSLLMFAISPNLVGSNSMNSLTDEMQHLEPMGQL
jgi:hypothetical protein